MGTRSVNDLNWMIHSSSIFHFSNHHRFKECLVSKSDSCCPECLNNEDAELPSSYAKMFLEKALGFVTKECNRAGYVRV